MYRFSVPGQYSPAKYYYITYCMDDQLNLKCGDLFHTFQEFEDHLNKRSEITYEKWSKSGNLYTIKSSNKKTTKYQKREDLVYSSIKICCVHGGEFKSRGTVKSTRWVELAIICQTVAEKEYSPVSRLPVISTQSKWTTTSLLKLVTFFIHSMNLKTSWRKDPSKLTKNGAKLEDVTRSIHQTKRLNAKKERILCILASGFCVAIVVNFKAKGQSSLPGELC